MKRTHRAVPLSDLERLSLEWAKAKIRYQEWLMRARPDLVDDYGAPLVAEGRELWEPVMAAELDLLTTCFRVLSQRKKKPIAHNRRGNPPHSENPGVIENKGSGKRPARAR